MKTPNNERTFYKMAKYKNTDDEILVQLTLLGNEEAYEELVARNEHRVLGTAYKVTKNSYLSEDACQDAFVSAWMNLSALKDQAKFSSWVCVIAKNHARTLNSRYASVIPHISLDIDDVPDIPDERGDGYIKFETEYDLKKAVLSLSEKIRETVYLHYFEDLSIKKIAERLCVAEGTVKWRLSEGRKQLRKGYGIMENTYNENESMTKRVMRQVEALKLWELKNNKTGFEEVYKAVLKAVEALEESKEKNHMLADTLLHGYWWAEGEKNDDVLARMKKAAENGHNDDVMQFVAVREHSKINDDNERINFMLNTQIPYCRGKGFGDTEGFIFFWLGNEYADLGKYQDATDSFKKVLEILPPNKVYHAAAKAALRHMEYNMTDPQYGTTVHVSGEIYRYINGKLYFWSQPGYGRGGNCKPTRISNALFYNCSLADRLIYDPEMEVGKTIISSDGKITLTYKENDAVIDTPAGRFEHCSVYICKGGKHTQYAESYFCPNVGLVYQKAIYCGKTDEQKLLRYTLNGGNGLLPFAPGNRWEYQYAGNDNDCELKTELSFEVTATENNEVTMSCVCISDLAEYKDTWSGNMAKAKYEYFTEDDKLVDIRDVLTRANELAITKRQKVHTSIAQNVMNRIMDTDNDITPDFAEKGLWNFFGFNYIKKANGRILIEHNRDYCFEWKNRFTDNAGRKLLYAFFYNIFLQATKTCIWDEKWTDSYLLEESKNHSAVIKNFNVSCGHTVTTPLDIFKDCRRITFDMGEHYVDYFNGKSVYYFAESIGIVRFEHYEGDSPAIVWQLTEYNKKGTGFFPIDDGIFRKFEPEDLSPGWHGSIEFTFDEDENGTVMFTNTYGTQDRENYLKSLEN